MRRRLQVRLVFQRRHAPADGLRSIVDSTRSIHWPLSRARANLSGANFTGANLSEANVAYVNLNEFDLSGAN
jgi:uncharacterized protein YjbI with pentapeptide repeats